MAAILENNEGIPKDRILLEDKAKDTMENALFVRKILKDKKVTNMVLVTTSFHMPRSKLIFEYALAS